MGLSGDGFSVIDFETTGFAARKADRVVEIGVVCVHHSGEVVEEWTTLVNPERDVSAGYVHGITARDVYGAPRFEEVAGLLADSLRGRILVAHNLSFEAQFLMAEFGRLGHDLELDRGSGICTMTLASTYIPHSPRNLQACCDCRAYAFQTARGFVIVRIEDKTENDLGFNATLRAITTTVGHGPKEGARYE